MPTVALMWEARAVPGRGAELLEWVREREPHGERQPLRREVFAAPEDRVLVITWWEGEYDTVVPELPDPPGELVRRAVHRWRFESVGG
ncbi:hypothetical protein ACFOSC_01250 [Streptantibioticus rubrisoli]|uniref:ABM domain-containing protein n=1 Tax=Streptantibioticus rubrisoli TaxID=1387313 RepID=A0ABT1PLV5_9ACTN|nr:hypothetical protein [Streptantibioticus rubrisoli]MCQ4046343.1 hypothetical protein [Streptantibioticus rubrisoli]